MNRTIFRKTFAGLLALALMLAPLALLAQQTREFGDYTIRFSAISTKQLVEEVAKRYGMTRSDRNGLLNIAVQKKIAGGEPQLVAATMHGSVADLTGHRHEIAFRETREEGDLDYLGEFPISGSGAVIFTIQITPEGRNQAYTLTFNQDYVTD